MTKKELSDILKSVGIPVNEGVTSPANFDSLPRIVYWAYLWEDRIASGQNYDAVNTYQISFYSDVPSDEKLLELRDILRKKGLHPAISHEYVDADRVWHSYFALEVIDDE